MIAVIRNKSIVSLSEFQPTTLQDGEHVLEVVETPEPEVNLRTHILASEIRLVDGIPTRVWTATYSPEVATRSVHEMTVADVDKAMGGGERVMLEAIMGAILALKADLAAAGLATPNFDRAIAVSNPVLQVIGRRNALLAAIANGEEPDF